MFSRVLYNWRGLAAAIVTGELCIFDNTSPPCLQCCPLHLPFYSDYSQALGDGNDGLESLFGDINAFDNAIDNVIDNAYNKDNALHDKQYPPEGFNGDEEILSAHSSETIIDAPIRVDSSSESSSPLPDIVAKEFVKIILPIIEASDNNWETTATSLTKDYLWSSKSPVCLSPYRIPSNHCPTSHLTSKRFVPFVEVIHSAFRGHVSQKVDKTVAWVSEKATQWWLTVRRFSRWLLLGFPMSEPLHNGKLALQTSPRKLHVFGSPVVPRLLKLEYDFAAFDSGARIVDSSPAITNVKAVQKSDQDSYLLVLCEKDTWFVLSFNTQILINKVVLMSQEFFSSAFKQVELYGSDTFPSINWKLLGVLNTRLERTAEIFDLSDNCASLQPSDCWIRYLFVKMTQYHPIEDYRYCTLNRLQVFGFDVFQSLDNKLTDRTEPRSPPVDKRKDVSERLDRLRRVMEENAVPSSSSDDWCPLPSDDVFWSDIGLFSCHSEERNDPPSAAGPVLFRIVDRISAVERKSELLANVTSDALLSLFPNVEERLEALESTIDSIQKKLNLTLEVLRVNICSQRNPGKACTKLFGTSFKSWWTSTFESAHKWLDRMLHHFHPRA